MKKVIPKVLGVVAFLIALFFGKIIGNTAVEVFNSSGEKSNLNSMLMKSASEINVNLPMMIDAETRLDATVGMNRIMRYNYTLINYSINEISAQDIQDSLTKKVTNYVCTTDGMKFFVNNNITVTYAYYSKEGKEITTIPVPSTKCKGI